MTTTTSKPRAVLGLIAAAGLTLAACGGGSEPTATDPPGEVVQEPTEESTETAEPSEPTGDTGTVAEPTAETPGDSPQVGYDSVQPAVVQIIAKGTIRDPELGYASNAGSGTGFIIDSYGTAVTNNHVVTGAATLEVYVGGELDRSFNATVLGVSECNDLAVIKINADQPLPYLAWHEGDLNVGTEVYAAGFPLGNPEFTLTRGIVAKAEAGGETPWASIDSTIEHDANIQPGNSGGPLVTADGQVAAVNYAVGSGVTASQFFAIRNDLARPVVEKLKNGDFESLGINGQAVYDEAQGIAGVWVAGVAPGSPASDVGLLPGDIVTALNGLPLGSDGTMSDYCDVLRTAGNRPIAIEVLRWDTSEVLKGEIRGDKPLEQVFSFAQELETETDLPDQPAAGGEQITGYTSVSDDTGQLSVDVPNEWSDVVTAPITPDDGTQVPFIAAAPSLDGFYSTWDTPGLTFAATTGVTVEDALASFAPAEGQCTDLGVQPYEDPAYTGSFQIFDACGGTGTAIITIAAQPPDQAFTAIVQMQLVSDADVDVLDYVINSFFVTV